MDLFTDLRRQRSIKIHALMPKSIREQQRLPRKVNTFIFNRLSKESPLIISERERYRNIKDKHLKMVNDMNAKLKEKEIQELENLLS